MLSVSVVLLRSSQGESFKDATLKSLLLAGIAAPVAECSPGDLGRAVGQSTGETVLLVTSGAVLLPDFLRAMLTTLEHQGADYVACRCARLSGEPRVVRAGESGFDPSQVLVKSWVYREIGIGNESSTELVGKVLGEYRGCEVPHILVVRI